MSLRLYLDDCAYYKVLALLLQKAGHAVTYPAQQGTASAKDAVHLDHCRQHDLILVTKNPKDFFELHEANSSHPGIFAIYQDNDVSRDMTHEAIVQAIANLEKAGVPIPAQFHTLNHWRT